MKNQTINLFLRYYKFRYSYTHARIFLSNKKNNHMRRIMTVLSVLIFAITFPAVAFANEKIADSLHSILIDVEKDTRLWIRCEPIHSSLNLIDFYRNRQFIPVWVDENGPTELGKSFFRTLESAETHGLHPDDYHYACIRAWMDSFHIFSQNGISINSKELANLDIVMTDAFMSFASHLVEGKVDPERLYPQWISEKRKANVFTVLHNLLEHRSLERAIKALAPPHRDYWGLVNAATHLKSVVDAGGWPLVPTGKRLRQGEKDQGIYLLRQRLEMSGDLISQQTADKSRFDKNLETAVKKFQARHGLKTDGIVGPETQTALNVSARDRRRQLLLNLERRRWLPHNWGDRYILVNTASFNLEAYHGEEQQLDMRVVVGKTYTQTEFESGYHKTTENIQGVAGKAYTQTPEFSKQMQYLTINPYWNVPRSIATEELLPQIKQDAGYLEKNHYELLSGWKEPAMVIDPYTIEWETIDDKNFPGRLRQQPGPWNILGRIKFIFPNRFDVYLHDTSQPYLFQNNNRALSHGCIRVEQPVDLALFLLQDDPSWTRERIQHLINSREKHVVRIRRPCMVHLLYWTAWIGKNGELQFRKDIYNRDGILWDALNKVPEAENVHQERTGPTSR